MHCKCLAFTQGILNSTLHFLQMSSEACLKALKNVLQDGLTYGDDPLTLQLPVEYNSHNKGMAPSNKQPATTSDVNNDELDKTIDVDDYEDFEPGPLHSTQAVGEAEETLLSEYLQTCIAHELMQYDMCKVIWAQIVTLLQIFVKYPMHQNT